MPCYLMQMFCCTIGEAHSFYSAMNSFWTVNSLPTMNSVKQILSAGYLYSSCTQRVCSCFSSCLPLLGPMWRDTCESLVSPYCQKPFRPIMFSPISQGRGGGSSCLLQTILPLTSFSILYSLQIMGTSQYS